MKAPAATSIMVYADWASLKGPRFMGTLLAQRIRGKEVFSFEYDPAWLSSGDTVRFLDPHLGLYPGKQYAPNEKSNFGLFLDSAPDRWGRMLMRSREAVMARAEGRSIINLLESDYLLGVFDGHRMGALRFKLSPEGDFLNNQKKLASPPWTSLRELEQASLNLEKDGSMDDPKYAKWLDLLLAPGSSLGGARPKAGVVDEKGDLWIAKFPSHHDDKNIGAWEMVLHHLAKACGIHVPEAKLMRFSGKHHTYLSKRFDRTDGNKRLHFASAMTLLGFEDGADHTEGAGYLSLAAFILQYGCSPLQDLEQLWRRMLFNVLVSNTDDHLRNHGFLMEDNGWRLSPAYDMNPNETGNGLTLNISDMSNEQDIGLVMDSAPYFRLKEEHASRILKKMKSEIRNWRSVAKNMGIPSAEIERTIRAFRLADH